MPRPCIPRAVGAHAAPCARRPRGVPECDGCGAAGRSDRGDCGRPRFPAVGPDPGRVVAHDVRRDRPATSSSASACPSPAAGPPPAPSPRSPDVRRSSATARCGPSSACSSPRRRTTARSTARCSTRSSPSGSPRPSPSSRGWASRCSTPRTCRRRSWPSSSRRWTCCAAAGSTSGSGRGGRPTSSPPSARPSPGAARRPPSTWRRCARSGPTTRWSSTASSPTSRRPGCCPSPCSDRRHRSCSAASADVALRRVGRIADGWISASRHDLRAISDAIGTIHAAATEAGRDPAALRAVVRGVVGLGDEVHDDAGRRPLTGSAEAIRDDLGRLHEAGVTEVFLDLNFVAARGLAGHRPDQRGRLRPRGAGGLRPGPFLSGACRAHVAPGCRTPSGAAAPLPSRCDGRTAPCDAAHGRASGARDVGGVVEQAHRRAAVRGRSRPPRATPDPGAAGRGSPGRRPGPAGAAA